MPHADLPLAETVTDPWKALARTRGPRRSTSAIVTVVTAAAILTACGSDGASRPSPQAVVDRFFVALSHGSDGETALVATTCDPSIEGLAVIEEGLSAVVAAKSGKITEAGDKATAQGTLTFLISGYTRTFPLPITLEWADNR